MIYFDSSCVFADRNPLSLLLHPFNITSLPFKDSKNWYVSFVTFACRGLKTEIRKLTFIVVSPRVGSSFSASIIEELTYLLKVFFSIFFKLVFVVRSNGCKRCGVMFFGIWYPNRFNYVLWHCRTSDTLTVDWAISVPYKEIFFDRLEDLFLYETS